MDNKTRSYTNKKGETIHFLLEEMDALVDIKLELQKASPSMRCNWSQLVKFAEKDGIEGTENSESFRCLIKAYQKSKGSLPSATKHAEIVSENKLQSIKEAVGELAWQKREVQGEARKLGKIKRDLIDESLFIQEVTGAIKEGLAEIDMSVKHTPTPSTFKKVGTKMILTLSDWHVGGLVDIKSNQYNFEIAKQRINKVTNSAIKIAHENGVKQIDVVYMGDILEHAYMRNSQAFHAEFTVSEQIAKAGRLLIETLTKLAKEFRVTYRGFSGNHDRLNGNKNDNIDGDTGMVVINEMVRQFAELASINLRYVKCDKFHAKMLDMNGRNFKFVHGDLEKRSDPNRIHAHSSRDGISYDAVVMGHYHHFACLEVGIGRYEIRVGSTKGIDDYSEKLGYGSSASQACILINTNGEIDVRKINC